MYSYIKGIEFAFFLDIDCGFCDSSDSVVFFVFILFCDRDLQPSMSTHRNANICYMTGVVS